MCRERYWSIWMSNSLWINALIDSDRSEKGKEQQWILTDVRFLRVNESHIEKTAEHWIHSILLPFYSLVFSSRIFFARMHRTWVCLILFVLTIDVKLNAIKPLKDANGYYCCYSKSARIIRLINNTTAPVKFVYRIFSTHFIICDDTNRECFFFSSRLELPIHFYCTTVLDEWSIIFVWMTIYVMGFPLLVLQTVSSFSISRCWLRRPILILFWRTKVENTHYSFHSGWFVFFLKFGRKKRSLLKRFAWRGFRSWSGGETCTRAKEARDKERPASSGHTFQH